jgi:outer membrane receptor protein involved in Fe transport
MAAPALEVGADMYRYTRLFALLLLASASRVSTVGAQETPGAAEPAKAPKGQIEEIVVTAEHRSEDISKVPMAITALTGDQMEQQGVKDIADVARLVPGLNFQSSGDSFGTTEISIRGINSQTGAAPTGIYVDDTPIQVRLSGFTGTSNPYPKVFDLDRIEVLKGPQGTLFGAGSEGGTVRFITPDPSLDKFSGTAHADVSYTDGGDPSWELGAAVGGPNVDGKIGFRASAWYQDEGGFVDRTDRDTNSVVDPNSDWQDTKVARVAFKLRPTDALTLTPSLFYQDTYTNDSSLWSLAEPCSNVSAHCQVPFVGGPFKNLSQIGQPDDDHFYLTGLNAEYAFDWFTVKSITSWFHRIDTRYSDGSSYDLSAFVPWDGNPYGGAYLPDGAPFVSHYFLQNGQENFTEELRIASNDDPDARFQWNAGLYWQHNRQDLGYTIREPLINVANDPTVIANEGLGCAPGSCTVADLMGIEDVGPFSYTDNEITHESQEAIYANVSYQVTDELKFEVGLRGARSVFDFRDVQNGPWNAHALPDGTYVGLSDNSASKKEYPVTPRISGTWQINDHQMIYGTIAEGYRIGGGNEDLSTLSACAQDFQNLGVKGDPETYGSDTTWNYEIGTKSKLFDNAVQIDADIFWINWENIQSQIYLPICGYTYTQNLGNAVSKGVELTATWIVSDGLKLSGNIDYTDARYDTTTSVGGNILALKGDSLGTPPFTFTVSAEHDQDLSDELSLYMRADFTYASHYTRTGSDVVYTWDPEVRPGLSTTDLSARVGLTKGGWDVSLYGENLANTHTITYAYHDTFYTPDLRVESQRPLTIGLTADYRF